MSTATVDPVKSQVADSPNGSKSENSSQSSTNGNSGASSTNGDKQSDSTQSSSSSGETKTDTQPILAPSKLGAPKTSSVLAPSRLFGSSSSSGGGGATQFGFAKTTDNPLASSKFKLKPSVLGSSTSSNPFLKAPAKESETDNNINAAENSDKGEDKTINDKESSSADKNIITDNSKTTAAAESSSNGSDKSHTANSMPIPPLTNNSIKSPALNVQSNFVFGQNLQSRVAETEGVASSATRSEEEKSAAAADNLFSAAASAMSSSDKSDTNGKSLETSSRELAEKESREKRKFDEVEVITGEETESNVLQMNCKVYTWLKGGWVERGRGILRLNDWGSGGVEMHSRLVIRTQGTLTIMLNTKIWSEMNVEKASGRGVRFTAMDPDGALKLYLVMGGTKDVELLFTSLEWRVSNNRRREQIESSSSKKAKTEELTQ